MAPNDDGSGQRTTPTKPLPIGRAIGPQAALLLSLLCACSPTLDWREQLAPDVGLRTTFPCHPDRHAREVDLAGQRVRMEMLVCAAGGATYAVGFFDMARPAETAGALSALRSVLIENIQSSILRDGRTPPQRKGFVIKGMTPNPEAGQWLVDGRRPDGSVLAARGAFFAHGLRIYQAVVIGTRLASDAVEPFFAGLNFPG